ncbi:hypothetical protein CEXT_505491 [Caerostris extrusa]|uniref:Uncharacterized protein n=1 Tax=Caerostris extrusa TaxID=172846 RepID=A0AAV4VE09_CAEEX|nr:hypothetical protein CEXT_505491 [Caerostris extrusa]
MQNSSPGAAATLLFFSFQFLCLHHVSVKKGFHPPPLVSTISDRVMLTSFRSRLVEIPVPSGVNGAEAQFVLHGASHLLPLTTPEVKQQPYQELSLNENGAI